MIIEQVESSPIGDYFHDSGIKGMFLNIENSVDSFEIESTELIVYCDSFIQAIKGLKSKIKSVESERIKQLAQEKIEDLVQKGGIE